MDILYKSQFQSNARRFQRCLERIAEKYSKVEYDHDAIEVDLNSTDINTLCKYMKIAKKNLVKLESMSFADSKGESLKDITGDSEFGEACNERSGDFETTGLSEVTQHEMQRNNSLLSNQPEHQDEELELSLQSRGSTLREHYPEMISQIGNAWRRQHVSEVAHSVQRRYRRWRKAHRTNSTHDVQRGTKETSTNELFPQYHYSLKSPEKCVTSTVAKAVSPFHHMAVHSLKSPYHCSPRRRQEIPVLAMNMSAIHKESERAKNKTFTMSEPSLFYSECSPNTSSSCYSPKMSFQDLALRKSMSPRRIQPTSSNVSAHGGTTLKEIYSFPVSTSPYKDKLTLGDSRERSNIYGSPTRSPFKLHTSIGSPKQSRYTPVASPKSLNMKQSFSREPKRCNSVSRFVPSPSKPTTSRRTLEYPDQCLSPRPRSPHLAKPRTQHRGLRRHLSFDSSTQTSARPFLSCKDFDDDFTMLYHKLVCLNKSSFLKGHPCRFCVKTSEASRGHSLSTLAALSLSPHRPLLRKRYGDLPSYPRSKRFRDFSWDVQEGL